MPALSPLQKFILKQCLETTVTKRNVFQKFYTKIAKPLKAQESPHLRESKRRQAGQQNAITKSLERLVDRGYMVGYGRRTPRKWFIVEVKLTPKGKKKSRTLLGQQQRIPF